MKLLYIWFTQLRSFIYCKLKMFINWILNFNMRKNFYTLAEIKRPLADFLYHECITLNVPINFNISMCRNDFPIMHHHFQEFFLTWYFVSSLISIISKILIFQIIIITFFIFIHSFSLNSLDYFMCAIIERVNIINVIFSIKNFINMQFIVEFIWINPLNILSLYD